MDIKMICALSIINACVGNDPSQVTERMNALKDIAFFGDTVVNPYVDVIKEIDISPQDYCKYSLMPMMKVIRFTPGNMQKWKDGLNEIHDLVEWYYATPGVFPLYKHVALNLLRYNDDIGNFLVSKWCSERSQCTLIRLYQMVPIVAHIDQDYNVFLNKIESKGLKYAVLNSWHHNTVSFIAKNM